MSQELLIENDDIEEIIVKLRNDNKWYNILLRNFCNFCKNIWINIKKLFSCQKSQSTFESHHWHYTFDNFYDEENPFYQEPDFYKSPIPIVEV